LPWGFAAQVWAANTGVHQSTWVQTSGVDWKLPKGIQFGGENVQEKKEGFL